MADKDILQEAVEAFHLDITADQQNREDAADDLKFRAGEQWPESVKNERTKIGQVRPMLTINRIPQFIRQVTGDLRQNRPSIKVRPVDEQGDPDIAKTYTGLIRHIEYTSDAQAAYITAAEHAANCGMGHFRILTDYCDYEGFDQEIKICRIRNPFSVVWDRNAVELTREDAHHCFVTQLLSKEAYKQNYPKASTEGFDSGVPSDAVARSWVEGDFVRVAEYWKRDYDTRTRHLLTDGTTAYEDDMAAIKAERPDVAVRQSRSVQVPKVYFYKLSGFEILEAKQEWAGRCIPIIPVLGEEVDIGERVVRHGLVRFVKDPQRLYNYWRTTAAETIALAPKQPFLVTEKQIAGQKAAWNAANSSSTPYLVYTPDPASAGAPQRSRPADAPAAMWEEAKIAEEDMHGTTGIYPPSLGQKSNETSGKAILARQKEGDVGTFVYADNLARAIRYAGTIIVDLIPKIYDTERVVRIIGEDDSEGWAKINTPIVSRTGQTINGAIIQFPGKPDTMVAGDFTAGKYDVTISTGPSYSTKRAESADQLMALITAVPQVGAIAGDLIVKALDLVDGEALQERLRKTLPPGLVKPMPGEEMPQTPPAPPDPKLVEIQMRPQLEQMKAQMKAESDTLIAHIKAAASIEVARINAGADLGAAAYAAEASAAGTMHATQVDADTRLKEAAMSNLTQAHTSGVTTAAQERMAAQKAQQGAAQ